MSDTLTERDKDIMRSDAEHERDAIFKEWLDSWLGDRQEELIPLGQEE